MQTGRHRVRVVMQERLPLKAPAAAQTVLLGGMPRVKQESVMLAVLDIGLIVGRPSARSARQVHSLQKERVAAQTVYQAGLQTPRVPVSAMLAVLASFRQLRSRPAASAAMRVRTLPQDPQAALTVLSGSMPKARQRNATIVQQALLRTARVLGHVQSVVLGRSPVKAPAAAQTARQAHTLRLPILLGG